MDRKIKQVMIERSWLGGLCERAWHAMAIACPWILVLALVLDVLIDDNSARWAYVNELARLTQIGLVCLIILMYVVLQVARYRQKRKVSVECFDERTTLIYIVTEQGSLDSFRASHSSDLGVVDLPFSWVFLVPPSAAFLGYACVSFVALILIDAFGVSIGVGIIAATLGMSSLVAIALWAVPLRLVLDDSYLHVRAESRLGGLRRLLWSVPLRDSNIVFWVVAPCSIVFKWQPANAMSRKLVLRRLPRRLCALIAKRLAC